MDNHRDHLRLFVVFRRIIRIVKVGWDRSFIRGSPVLFRSCPDWTEAWLDRSWSEGRDNMSAFTLIWLLLLGRLK